MSARAEGDFAVDDAALDQLVAGETEDIPKPTKPSRIAENIDVFDFELSTEDMSSIDGLDTARRGGPEHEAITIEASVVRSRSPEEQSARAVPPVTHATNSGPVGGHSRTLARAIVHDPAAVAGEFDFSALPNELRHLAPLISRYAESDDVDRSEMLEQASDDELRELSEAPEAHWEAINAFLDQNVEAAPGPTQDVALALDSFAQAAMEAKFELDARADR